MTPATIIFSHNLREEVSCVLLALSSRVINCIRLLSANNYPYAVLVKSTNGYRGI